MPTRFGYRKDWVKPYRVIAIDGESLTSPEHTEHCKFDDGVNDWICSGHEHRYVLLVAADDYGFVKKLERKDSEITTEEAINFILDLGADNIDTIIVGFSFQYDVAMILREWILKQDDPKSELRKLNHGENVTICDGKFLVTNFSRKLFIIKDIEKGRSTTVVNDVFGYFQTSFVDTISAWKVTIQSEINRIKAMKDTRGDFTEEKWDEIQQYCVKECIYLAQLTDKLLNAIGSAGLGSLGYYGPGSLAKWKLHERKIQQYFKAKGIIPSPMFHRYVLRAYFGGRFDVAEAGYHNDTWQYDINSAYPYQITKLPCLVHGKWKFCTQYDATAKIAVWTVRWKLPNNTRWTPFPYRTKTGRIYYPYIGYGRYWQDEVREALELLPTYKKEGKASIEVIDGWVFESNCDHKPGEFIQLMYDHRSKLKSDGNAAEKPMKLTYNSMYGMFAQTKSKHLPPFQNFIWAGMITSGARAQLLRALRFSYDDALMCATDSILCRPNADLSGMKLSQTLLGYWDTEHTGKCWLIQPGLAWFPDKEKRAAKTRGHNPDDIDGVKLRKLNFREGKRGWIRLTDMWKRWYWIRPKDDAHFTYFTKIFIGIGMASQLTEFEQFYGRWVTQERTVNFWPARRTKSPLPLSPSDIDKSNYIDHQNEMLFHNEHRVMWFPTAMFRDDMDCNPSIDISYPYQYKGEEFDMEFMLDKVTDQDQPDIEDEN
jgi:hypothetical protein